MREFHVAPIVPRITSGGLTDPIVENAASDPHRVVLVRRDEAGWIDVTAAYGAKLWRNLAGADWVQSADLAAFFPKNSLRYGCAMADYDDDQLLDIGTEPRHVVGHESDTVRLQIGTHDERATGGDRRRLATRSRARIEDAIPFDGRHCSSDPLRAEILGVPVVAARRARGLVHRGERGQRIVATEFGYESVDDPVGITEADGIGRPRTIGHR